MVITHSSLVPATGVNLVKRQQGTKATCVQCQYAVGYETILVVSMTTMQHIKQHGRGHSGRDTPAGQTMFSTSVPS